MFTLESYKSIILAKKKKIANVIYGVSNYACTLCVKKKLKHQKVKSKLTASHIHIKGKLWLETLTENCAQKYS